MASELQDYIWTRTITGTNAWNGDQTAKEKEN